MVVYLRKNLCSLLAVFKKKAGPRSQEEQKRLAVHYTASQHYQENVFIEASRPQYLEDLHTEARQGLKILQQEEHKHGVDFQPDQSIATAGSLQAEQQEEEGPSPGSRDRDGSPESGSTAGSSVTTATPAVSSAVSTTRPVLTRQGSTFKPLNPVERGDKGKKRSRRTTIMGIPQQVQRELALHRGMVYQQGPSPQIPNGSGGQAGEDQAELVIIPTIDGETTVANQEGARVHLQDLEASREDKLLQHHLQTVYRDEQAFGHHRLGPRFSPASSKRPKSLAVPGMTSSFSPSFLFLQEPQGPVMCVSPQATYLSKIIPNAVLPASVDVIQIDRGNSRNRNNSFNRGGKGHAVSKSSLASAESSASPASSRRSGGDGSHSDGVPDNPPATPSVASASNWSQSSETVISNSSTISSKGSLGMGRPQTVSHARQGGQARQHGGDQDMVSLQSSVSWVSGTSSPGTGRGSESGISESVSAGEMSNTGRENVRDSRSFSRSLSIMKTKLPPTPPRRTNSLHHENMARRQPREQVDITDLSDSVFVEAGEVNSEAMEETRVVDSTGSASSDQIPVCVSDKSRSPNDSRSSATLGPPTSRRGTSEPQPVSGSSSPQKAPSERGRFERTMSPSSGYSSQSGTPTLSPKGIPPISPSTSKQRKKPVKPERSGSRASSCAVSVSSSLTSLSSATSEPVNQEAQANSPSPPQQGSPPPVAVKTLRVSPVNLHSSPVTVAIRELFNVPPPPKVKAPSPPPPETWSHNRNTIELLCGPSPHVTRRLQRQPKGADRVQTTDSQTDVSDKPQDPAEKEPLAKDVVLSKDISLSDTSKHEKGSELVSQEDESDRSPKVSPGSPSELQKDEAYVQVQRSSESRGPLAHEDGTQERVTVAKKEPPPVMKKSTPASLRKGPEKLAESQQQAQVGVVATEIKVESPVKNELSILPEVAVDNAEEEEQVTTEHTGENPTNPQTATILTLSVEPPKVDKTSPPPSPPPAHQPPPPPSKKTPPSSVSSEDNHGAEEEDEVPMVETCWPPPPPPLEGSTDSVFDGPDELDFPPPPPPFMTESLLPDVVESCSPVMEVEDSVSIAALEGPEGTPDGDTTDLTSVTTQTELDQSRAEEDNHSIPAATLISEVPEPSHLHTPSLEESAVTQEATYLSTATPQSQEVPPLPECVSLPPQEAPPPPPVTSAEKANSSPSLAPSPVVPMPPHLPVEERPPSSQPPVSLPCPPPINSAPPPALSAENHSATGMAFRRPPSQACRESRGKDLLSRHKSAPIPKEDANIPLVTPSLLQMVRLRSVTVGDEQQTKDLLEDDKGESSQNQSPTLASGANSVPQKPVRKSLSIKSPSSSARSPSVTLNAPSMRLQEAIRMKTAAMSSRDGLPTRLTLRSSANSSESSLLSLRSPEGGGGDLHKSSASTASFIFSRSAKKVVIETPASSSPEAQASLKQSLAAELMQVSDQSKAAVVANGIGDKANLSKMQSKIPPPVAKKPPSGSSVPSENPVCSGGAEKLDAGAETNGGAETLQPADQQTPPDQQTPSNQQPGTTETTDMFDASL